MTYEIVTAQFCSCEQVNRALWGLRQAGAIGDTGALPYAGQGRRATLHLSVRPSRTREVQDILRRFGGQLSRF